MDGGLRIAVRTTLPYYCRDMCDESFRHAVRWIVRASAEALPDGIIHVRVGIPLLLRSTRTSVLEAPLDPAFAIRVPTNDCKVRSCGSYSSSCAECRMQNAECRVEASSTEDLAVE